MTIPVPVSLGAAADLLAAVFRRDRDELRQRLGAAPRKGRAACANCGKLTIQRKYCSRQCRTAHTRTRLTCPMCGKIFFHYRSYVAFRLSHPSRNGKRQERFFCSNSCTTNFNVLHDSNFGKGRFAGKRQEWIKLIVPVLSMSAEERETLLLSVDAALSDGKRVILRLAVK